MTRQEALRDAWLELVAMNHALLAAEAVLAEVGELTDNEARAALINAEATRGRLGVLVELLKANNPAAGGPADDPRWY